MIGGHVKQTCHILRRRTGRCGTPKCRVASSRRTYAVSQPGSGKPDLWVRSLRRFSNRAKSNDCGKAHVLILRKVRRQQHEAVHHLQHDASAKHAACGEEEGCRPTASSRCSRRLIREVSPRCLKDQGNVAVVTLWSLRPFVFGPDHDGWRDQPSCDGR
jgi:hypothetical protein